MEIFFPTFSRLLYTIGVIFILARFLYYPRNGNKEFMFTYIVLATILAILCILIKRVDLSFGLALGIFAIFSLLRYRTVSISIRDMTYLFLCAGIAAKNSLYPDEMEFYRLLFTDSLILVLVAVSEFFLFRQKHITKTIIYNNPGLVHPDKRKELLDDLQKQFGISEVKEVKFGRIDTLKHSVRMKVTFKDDSNAHLPDD